MVPKAFKALLRFQIGIQRQLILPYKGIMPTGVQEEVGQVVLLLLIPDCRLSQGIPPLEIIPADLIQNPLAVFLFILSIFFPSESLQPVPSFFPCPLLQTRVLPRT